MNMTKKCLFDPHIDIQRQIYGLESKSKPDKQLLV